MIEQLFSMAAALVIFAAVCLRLNILKAQREDVNRWRVLEVIGLATLLGGCAGSMGEWFLPNAEFHAETIVLCGAALFAVGVSRGALCQLVARLQGWDGTDRRGVYVRGTRLDAREFLDDRVQRRST